MLPIKHQHRLQLPDVSPIQSDTEDEQDGPFQSAPAQMPAPSITFEDVDVVAVQNKAQYRTPLKPRQNSRPLVQPSPRSTNNPFGKSGRDAFPSLDDWLQQHGHDLSTDLEQPAAEEFQANFEWSIDGKASLFPVEIDENDYSRIDPNAHLAKLTPMRHQTHALKEAKLQQEIDRFFSPSKRIVPSPSPWQHRVKSRTSNAKAGSTVKPQPPRTSLYDINPIFGGLTQQIEEAAAASCDQGVQTEVTWLGKDPEPVVAGPTKNVSNKTRPLQVIQSQSYASNKPYAAAKVSSRSAPHPTAFTSHRHCMSPSHQVQPSRLHQRSPLTHTLQAPHVPRGRLSPVAEMSGLDGSYIESSSPPTAVKQHGLQSPREHSEQHISSLASLSTAEQPSSISVDDLSQLCQEVSLEVAQESLTKLQQLSATAEQLALRLGPRSSNKLSRLQDACNQLSLDLSADISGIELSM
eukprot:TRINITY_DN1883_c0_g1_i2.p1 TRINITY_DN1883_c0_g1~~TRINITY_DN1883_c0_g1_i2.p1  ORF type:complete len:464 (+),score=74.68 TRINITY_DN1883_c0_g1_i2:100-1491(+)